MTSTGECCARAAASNSFSARLPTAAAFGVPSHTSDPHTRCRSDGDLDLISAPERRPKQIFLNDGAGVFTGPKSDEFSVASLTSDSIALVDLDNDVRRP